MTWGKVDPDRLPDSVICYTDSTLALPLLTAYALDRHEPRPLKRLYDRLGEMYDTLRSTYLERESSGTPTGLASRQKTADEPSSVRHHPDSLDRSR